jgi:aminopeptidase-like protein
VSRRVAASPTSGSFAEALDSPDIGEQIYALAAEIYPICRSIAGPGVRETLAHLQQHVAIEPREIPSGTPILDWTAPKEWTIRDAWIKNAAGDRVLDFNKHNLHVLNYSAPVRGPMPLAELKKNIFTLPDQPDLIPYRTSYYAERWGFCMSHRALMAMPDGEYDVLIDAAIEDGFLTYGEFVHRGETDAEVLFSTHICHPSLANDNCSGLALLTHVAKRVSALRTRYTYRFLWAPGTIGAIAWLAQNDAGAARIKHGLVLSCVGDRGSFTYKRTRRGDAAIDRAAAHVLGPEANLIDFFPYGYDERQYNSPGYKLDVGLLQRSQFATFPEYHTSADNLDFIAPEALADSYRAVARMIDVLERDRAYLNLSPKGEPQLGRRGLYGAIGGDKDAYAKNMAMLWILNLSDGGHSLLDIAERSKTPFAVIADTAALLEKAGLLEPLSP